MLQRNAFVLLSLVEFVLCASLQTSLRGLDERDPSLKPIPSVTAVAVQDKGEDLSHQLQQFGTTMLRDWTKVQGQLSTKEEPVDDDSIYNAPLRKFGGDANNKNDTETKQENDLPPIPGIGDAISDRERTATQTAPGAGTKDKGKDKGGGWDAGKGDGKDK